MPNSPAPNLPTPNSPPPESVGTSVPPEPENLEASLANAPAAELPIASPEPKPSYVKLAMRNMVRKRGQSLSHFFLTTVGLLGLFVGLAYLTR
jgi:Protein of unknown function (DUF3285)